MDRRASLFSSITVAGDMTEPQISYRFLQPIRNDSIILRTSTLTELVVMSIGSPSSGTGSEPRTFCHVLTFVSISLKVAAKTWASMVLSRRPAHSNPWVFAPMNT